MRFDKELESETDLEETKIYDPTLKRGSKTECLLPPIRNDREYTLVLDLDETLIHYDVDDQENEGYYLIRPGALRFLEEMAKYYEIVLFTAATPEVRYSI